MVATLLLVFFLVVLFSMLGITISPLFFILLVAVLLLTGSGRFYARRW
jgi:hypothetical protein